MRDRAAASCREVILSCRVGGNRCADTVAHHQRAWTMKRVCRASLFVSLAAVVLAATGGISYALLSRSDIFKITDLVVQGNREVPAEQILAQADLKRGGNLLALDTVRVEGMILTHPWIEQASVTRNWPSSVIINVTEYRPLALVNLEREGKKHLYYVNKNGIVFAPSTPSRDLDFPVLTGDSLELDFRNGEIAAGSLSAMALEFLNLAARGNQILPAQAVSEVNVSEDKGVIVYLVDHPFPIYMGSEKMRTRFNLLVRVLAQLYRQDKVKDIAEIRMDYAEDRILVANIGT